MSVETASRDFASQTQPPASSSDTSSTTQAWRTHDPIQRAKASDMAYARILGRVANSTKRSPTMPGFSSDSAALRACRRQPIIRMPAAGQPAPAGCRT